MHLPTQSKVHSRIANWVVKQSIQPCTHQPNQKCIAALLTGWSNNPFNHCVCHHTRVPTEKAATACALAPVKMAAPATTSPASASARRACRERTVRTAAPLATSARPATSSASSSVPPATATASSASASAGQGGSVPPATYRVRCSPGGPTACSSVTASPRTPRAATQRWGNLGCSYALFLFCFVFSQKPKSGLLSCWFFLCIFFFSLFSFSQKPGSGLLQCCYFLFLFSFSQKPGSGLLPCWFFFVYFFFLSFFFFSKTWVWATPMFFLVFVFFFFFSKAQVWAAPIFYFILFYFI